MQVACARVISRCRFSRKSYILEAVLYYWVKGEIGLGIVFEIHRLLDFSDVIVDEHACVSIQYSSS